MSKECWEEIKYEECPSEPKPEIYDKAVELFDPYKNNTIYGEPPGQEVKDPVNPDKTRVTENCFSVVSKTLTKLGYDSPSEMINYHKYTDPDTGEQKPLPYSCEDSWDPNAFCQIYGTKSTGTGIEWVTGDIQGGDIVIFAPDPQYAKNHPGAKIPAGHYAIIKNSPNPNDGWEFTTYTAQHPPEAGDPNPWGIFDLDERINPWGTDPLYICAVIRPRKKSFDIKCKDPDPPPNTPQAHRMDPLILDLDGNGIGTLGLSAGIHFDHDGNGFKELTGWVAPGDGMLMLDMNGNGRLDRGKELFGSFMILPNGAKAGNGFQALAYHDVNGDGKIDSADPIWSQLKVWQHIDYDSDTLNTNTSTGHTYFLSQSSSGCG